MQCFMYYEADSYWWDIFCIIKNLLIYMHSSWEEAEEKNLVEQYSLIFRGFEGLQELKKRKKKKHTKKTSLISYAGRVDAP